MPHYSIAIPSQYRTPQSRIDNLRRNTGHNNQSRISPGIITFDGQELTPLTSMAPKDDLRGPQNNGKTHERIRNGFR